MTPEQIIDGNLLIAEFVGYFDEQIRHAKRFGKEYDWRADKVEIESLKYHSSWDSLMPVVEKIATIKDLKYRGIDGTARIHFYSDGVCVCRICDITIEDSGVNSVWLAVVEFIKRHNKNK